MGILDWLRPLWAKEEEIRQTADDSTSGDGNDLERRRELMTSSDGLSRREFFARFAGREPIADSDSPAPPPDPDVLHTFPVARFPYHDGPVLVPSLRVGEEFRLAADPPYSKNPTGLRIERGRDLLGFVPDELFEDVQSRIDHGDALICRAVRVDPSAELSQVLTVEIRRTPEEADDSVEDLAVGEEG